MISIKHNRLRFLGVSALALFLGACAAPVDPETGAVRLRASPETAQLGKKINVQEVTPIFAVRFDRQKAALSDMEKGRLLGFLQAQKARFGDEMQLELPPFDDAERVNESRYGAIGSFLQDEGFVVTPKVTRDGLRDSLRVYYTKYIATVDPDCAKGWRRPEGTNYENLPLPNMGCSTASALAQMLENPKDLVAPQTPGGYDGARAALSIKKYRGGSSGGSGGSAGGASGSSGGGSAQ